VKGAVRIRTILVGALAAVSAAAFAHSDEEPPAHMHHAMAATAFGEPGDPQQVTNVIHVDMTDDFRYSPDKLSVKAGETVRIIVHNRGRLMHEIVIGSAAELEEHAAMMRQMQHMKHDDAFMAHVAPGGQASIIWRFTNAGEFKFACLIAGHFEAGMVGDIVVR